MSGKKNKRNKGIVYIAGIVMLLSVVLLVMIKGKEYQERKRYEALQESVTQEAIETADIVQNEEAEITEADMEESVQEDSDMMESANVTEETAWYADYAKASDREIDFEELKSVNADVYAWISVPGTEIDYPIAHCDAQDPVYLDHDIDGNSSSSGMIFTDTYNSNDFSDPMTLIYGHNMKNGTMFAGLHAFRDSRFFEQNDTIKIYMDGIELDYRIYDCFVAKNEHILENNDFHDALVFTRYFEDLSAMRDLSANFRKDMEVSFTDHVITLVTCIGENDKRLFVQAVLQESDNHE